MTSHRKTLEARASNIQLKLVKFSRTDAYAPRDAEGRMYQWALTTPGYQPRSGYHTLEDLKLALEQHELSALSVD